MDPDYEQLIDSWNGACEHEGVRSRNSQLRGDPGKGRFFLPAARQRARLESEAEKEAELDALTGTILVVEDDEVLRSMVVRLLDLPGLKVLEAENAHAALHLVARYRGQIDLLLTDVVMPTISGGELAGRVRAIEPDVKVLFMSGYSSELVAHGAAQRGTRVLEKPFTRRALLSQIRFALQN